jgi:putative ABC transport system permease protein
VDVAFDVEAHIGSIAGIAVGTFLGWSLFGVASTAAGFTIPVARLGIVAVIGTVAGIVAARRPSKRAARLAILDAIATQ